MSWYRVCYGDISDEERVLKALEEENPYGIFNNEHLIHGISFEIISWARKHKLEEHAVDWGSDLWKCTGRDILAIKESYPGVTIEDEDNIDADAVYGLEFVEMINDTY